MQCDPTDQALIDALDEVCRSVEADAERIICRNGSATLEITDNRVEGSMPLHRTRISPVETISVEEGSITVRNNTTTYEFRVP